MGEYAHELYTLTVKTLPMSSGMVLLVVGTVQGTLFSGSAVMFIPA